LSKFEFIPTLDQTENSNIFRFMKSIDISTLDELSRKANSDLEWFWKEVEQYLGIVWAKPYERILDLSKGKPFSKWFIDGKTNIYKSSVEKFAKIQPNKIAYTFVSEDGNTSSLTYLELDKKVCKLANSLKSLGIRKGDVIAIYLPMIEESILAILASAKIGAVQTVIFSGYSSESLQIRLQDCNAKILFVCDGFQRKGKGISQKNIINSAIQNTKIEKIIVVSYKGIDIYNKSGKILFYNDLVNSQSESCFTENTDSEDPLFILYTSGTTGKPKGVIHVHGGFSVFSGYQASFLIDTTKTDVILWPADIGWITGLVWNVYGLLLLGARAIIYDGAIDFPNFNRIWDMVENYSVTIFGLSPTAVRMYKKNNVQPLKLHSLDKIKNMPTTGEPLDEDSWRWLFEKVGNKKIPIMNLSGGTEIGGAMLSVFPGMKLKPSTVGIPCPGIKLDVYDENGKSVIEKDGFLVIKSPWPAMTRGLLNDNKRYLETYWSRFDNIWFHGDYVFVDSDGLWYMKGRSDDVINVSGHRMSTAEIEQTAINHKKISEAASISIPDDITGESIVIFVVPEGEKEQNLDTEISNYVSEKIGKLAKPKFVFVLSDLPKTRTGKIMRRLLKAKLLGLNLGDLSSLENPKVLDEISKLE
jgi:acetyl-CoA synthetase